MYSQVDTLTTCEMTLSLDPFINPADSPGDIPTMLVKQRLAKEDVVHSNCRSESKPASLLFRLHRPLGV